MHVLGGAARCWDTQLDANASYIQRTCDSRPFVIFGHSFGSIAAFELCSHLQELHFEMPGCLIVSGSPTPAMFEWKKDMAPFNYFDMEVKDAAGVRDVLCLFHVLDANMDVLTDDLLLADLSLVARSASLLLFHVCCIPISVLMDILKGPMADAGEVVHAPIRSQAGLSNHRHSCE